MVRISGANPGLPFSRMTQAVHEVVAGNDIKSGKCQPVIVEETGSKQELIYGFP